MAKNTAAAKAWMKDRMFFNKSRYTLNQIVCQDLPLAGKLDYFQ